MTPRATGRTRTVSVACTGRYAFAVPAGGALPDHNPNGWADVFGWLIGAGGRAGISAVAGGGGSADFFLIAAAGPPFEPTPSANPIFVTTTYTWAGGHTFFGITSIAVEVEGIATYTLEEWEDGGAPYEIATGISLALSATADIGFTDITGLHSDSVHLSGSWSGSLLDGTPPDYSISYLLQILAPISISGDFAVTCDGISFTAAPAVSRTIGGATLSGGPAGMTLASSTDAEVSFIPPSTVVIVAEQAGASANFEPDWARQATIQARYYGGTAFPGAELELRLNADGTGVLDSAATDAGGVAILAYPAGGYYGSGLTAWERWALSVTNKFAVNGDNEADSFDNLQQLANYQAQVYVSEAWADSYGSDGGRPGPGGTNLFSRVIGLYAGPKFTAGELDVAATHAFDVFAALTDWTALGGGSLALDSGVWEWLPDGGAGFGQAVYAPKFLPIAYRYYTLRLKSDVATTVRLRATLWRGTTSDGAALNARATWIVSLAGGGYEDHEIDWLMPDELEDDLLATAPSPISQRGPFHPYFCQAHYQATGAAITLNLVIPANVTLHVESLAGHQRADGGRTALTLHGPLPDGSFSQPETAVKPNPGVEGDLNWGWLQVNGALGAFLAPPSGTVQDGVTALRALYDTTARDTGLTISDAAHGLSARNPWGPESWLVADGVTLPRGPADAPTTPLVCVRRIGSTYGYYGMGQSYENGAYGATLIYQGDLWLDGELTLLAWKPRASVAGVVFELIDNDTGAVLDTVTTDDDGFAALSAKYGVRLPFSSAPTNDQLLPAHQQFTDHGFAPPDYTAEGKKLSSYWLSGLGKFRERPGDVIEYSPQQQFQYNYAPHREDVEVWTAQPHHYDVPIGSGSRSPDNLTDALGRFHRASIDDQGAGDTLVYRRMDYNTPEGGGWAVETDLGADRTEPSLAVDSQELQLRASITYTTDAGICERVSDDDAATFEEETLVIPSGTRSRNFVSPYTGERWIAAYVAGNIQAVYRGPGDADWSDVFTFLDQDGVALTVEDDAFDVTFGHEPGTGYTRALMSVVILGETEVSEWVCDAEPDWDAPEMRWERLT